MWGWFAPGIIDKWVYFTSGYDMATLLPHTSQRWWDREGHQVPEKSAVPKRWGSCVMFSSRRAQWKKPPKTDININRDGTTRGSKSNVANWNNTECWKSAINLGDSLSELKNRLWHRVCHLLIWALELIYFALLVLCTLSSWMEFYRESSLCCSTMRWVLLKTQLFSKYAEFYGDSQFRVLFWAFFWEIFIARTIWLNREDSYNHSMLLFNSKSFYRVTILSLKLP